MTNLSVIVPVYNFKTKIIDNLELLINKLNSFEKNHELIIIDDGSSDGTVHEIENFIKNNIRIKFLKNDKNEGKGYCVRRGFVNSIGKIKLFIDCDIPYIDRLEEMYFEVYKKKFDVCIIERVFFLKDLKSINFIIRRLISFLFNFTVKFFFVQNINDTQSGLKVFNGDIKILNTYSLNKFLFDIELLMYCRKKKLDISILKEQSNKTNIKYNSNFIFDLKIYYNVLKEFLKLLKLGKL